MNTQHQKKRSPTTRDERKPQLNRNDMMGDNERDQMQQGGRAQSENEGDPRRGRADDEFDQDDQRDRQEEFDR